MAIVAAAPAKRPRGRPKGSKTKASEAPAAAAAAAEAVGDDAIREARIEARRIAREQYLAARASAQAPEEEEEEEETAIVAAPPAKRPRGRPKGSQDKSPRRPKGWKAQAAAAAEEVAGRSPVQAPAPIALPMEVEQAPAEDESPRSASRVHFSEMLSTAIEPPLSRRSSRHVPLYVEEHNLGCDGYSAAKQEFATWARIDKWANTKHRTVVQRVQLKRLLGFTTTILVVHREDGRPHGMALLCETPNEVDLCDSLHVYRNPSLPQVRTSRTKDFIPIKEYHVRGHVRKVYDRCIAAHPVDELVLICGERGSGAAIMAHLRGRQRLLFASVVPGCERAQRFYERYFDRIPLERKDGEHPYVAWLGAPCSR